MYQTTAVQIRVHGILTYYFARALQDGNTGHRVYIAVPATQYDILHRERLHNRAQDPVFIGNSRVNLIDITEN